MDTLIKIIGVIVIIIFFSIISGFILSWLAGLIFTQEFLIFAFGKEGLTIGKAILLSCLVGIMTSNKSSN